MGCGPAHQQKSIAANLKKNKGKVIFSQLYGPEWSRLYVFAPYSDEQQISKVIKHQFDKGVSSIASSDASCLLVLTADNGIVAVIEYKRSLGDFSKLYRSNGYSREEAVFVLESDEGWPVFKFYEN